MRDSAWHGYHPSCVINLPHWNINFKEHVFELCVTAGLQDLQILFTSLIFSFFVVVVEGQHAIDNCKAKSSSGKTSTTIHNNVL